MPRLGNRSTSSSAMVRASPNGRQTSGSSAINRASCSAASRALSNDNRLASSHGSSPMANESRDHAQGNPIDFLVDCGEQKLVEIRAQWAERPGATSSRHVRLLDCRSQGLERRRGIRDQTGYWGIDRWLTGSMRQILQLQSQNNYPNQDHREAY